MYEFSNIDMCPENKISFFLEICPENKISLFSAKINRLQEINKMKIF